MTNRRLVPMPAKESRRSDIPPAPVAAIAPSGLKSWHTFAFLIATAIAWYYVGKLVLFVVAVVLVIRGWWWLSCRFPRTMFSVNAFSAGLIRGGRRR